MAYRTRLLHLALAAACAATGFVPATAAAFPLLAGLGGPDDYGTNNLPGNDDGSTGEIDVSSAFPNGLRFFGMTFRSLYLNNNGNVTFGGALGEYTPQAFPVADQRMIAPWWGDVDTRGTGYPAHNAVFWAVTGNQFVGTWHNVGYYGVHDDLQNDFQLILTDRSDVTPGDFDVEFRYAACQWVTGDASGGSGGHGGTPAQAGFDAGNLRDFYALPGSLTEAIVNVCTTSNVDMPGRWDFQIRSGVVAICGNGVLEPGEQCDDGNTVNGDGCSSSCRLERDVPPDVIEDVPDDVGFDVQPDEGPDAIVGRDVVRDHASVGDVPIVRPDGAGPDGGADTTCDGWRCGRELWLEGSAGPAGACACSAPGAVRGGATGALGGLGFVAASGAVAARVARRRRRRSSRR